MAQAYYVPGDSDEGIGKAQAFAKARGLAAGSPDLVTLRYALFSVDDARALLDIALASALGEHKVVIIAVTRFFHEAQNALLKLFEEPPTGVTLILVIPSEGILIPTLRSRLVALPGAATPPDDFLSPLGRAFLEADAAEREKLVGKLVEQSKSDKDEEKQRGRSDAVRLAEDLLRAAERARARKGSDAELLAFSEDLTHFLPILHTRSAPLKLIYEHLLLVIPRGLDARAV